MLWDVSFLCSTAQSQAWTKLTEDSESAQGQEKDKGIVMT